LLTLHCYWSKYIELKTENKSSNLFYEIDNMLSKLLLHCLKRAYIIKVITKIQDLPKVHVDHIAE